MKKFLDGWFRIGERIANALSYVSMVFTIGMMLCLFVDSMLGLIFNSRILGIYEIVQIMLCVFVFTSWSYTQAHKGHIHVTLFISKFPQKLKFFCYGFTALVSVVTMVFGTYGGYLGIVEKLENGECSGTLMIPYWPMYIFMTLAYVLFVYMLLNEALKAVYAFFNKEMAEELSSEWT